MTPADPLAQLNPLRAPGPVEWWPPAPGWWLLAGLVLIILAVAAWLAWRAYQRRAYRRQACADLVAARTTWLESGDTLAYLQQVNRTLKAVAQRSFPGTDSASLSGQHWRDFLNRAVPAPLFEVALDWAPYTPEPPEQTVAAQLGEQAEQWVLQHRGAP